MISRLTEAHGDNHSNDLLTLEEAAQLLGITVRSLSNWLRADSITTVSDEHDKRRQLLHRSQVEELAAAHRRTLNPSNTLAPLAPQLGVLDNHQPLQGILGMYVENLRQEVNRLRARVEDLEKSAKQQRKSQN